MLQSSSSSSSLISICIQPHCLIFLIQTTKATNTMEQQLPWIEKYRPTKLDELVSQDDIVSTINRLIDAKQLPHLLFYGPPGSGKTSLFTSLFISPIFLIYYDYSMCSCFLQSLLTPFHILFV